MEEQIDRAKRGNREALGELVAEHYARVYRFCARRIGEELAADAAKETFITMQRTSRRYEGRSTVSTWLIGIAHNHCRNLSRKAKAEPAPIEEWFDVAAPDHGNRVVAQETLRSALGELSADHREVVVLHEVEGLTYGEIAEIVGVPEGTVKSRLYHAFRNLREQLCEVTQ